MTGKHLTGTVIYGYLWADEKRERWIVDEEAAAVVRRILRRKANGKQREYEERVKEKKQKKKEAQKLALWAEDMANDVFIPVRDLPSI